MSGLRPSKPTVMQDGGQFDKFEEIANETVSKAQKVECSVEDYVKGLRLIVETVEGEIDAAERR